VRGVDLNNSPTLIALAVLAFAAIVLAMRLTSSLWNEQLNEFVWLVLGLVAWIGIAYVLVHAFPSV
jgi:hypothetical protein